jgi:hypothetical protein
MLCSRRCSMKGKMCFSKTSLWFIPMAGSLGQTRLSLTSTVESSLSSLAVYCLLYCLLYCQSALLTLCAPPAPYRINNLLNLKAREGFNSVPGHHISRDLSRNSKKPSAQVQPRIRASCFNSPLYCLISGWLLALAPEPPSGPH